MGGEDIIVTPKEWVHSLMRPENECRIDLAGFPGYYIFEDGLQMRVLGLQEHLLHFVTEGKMLVRTASGQFSVAAGSLCVLSPNVGAEYSSQDMNTLGTYRFRIKTLTEGRNTVYPHDFLFVDQAWHLQFAVEEILRHSQNLGDFYSLSVRGALAMIFSNLFQTESVGMRSISGLTPSQMSRVREYYHRTYKSWPQPSDLAAQVDLSLDYFTRLFRHSFGVSPRKWLVHERIRLSRVLLAQSSDSVVAVAKKLGYSNHRLFVRQFKNCSGCTPTAYRKNRRVS